MVLGLLHSLALVSLLVLALVSLLVLAPLLALLLPVVLVLVLVRTPAGAGPAAAAANPQFCICFSSYACIGLAHEVW